jgi:hypothetical protein
VSHVIALFILLVLLQHIHFFREFAQNSAKRFSKKKWYVLSFEKHTPRVVLKIRSTCLSREEVDIVFQESHQSVRLIENLEKFDVIELCFTNAMLGYQPAKYVGSYLTLRRSVLS